MAAGDLVWLLNGLQAFGTAVVKSSGSVRGSGAASTKAVNEGYVEYIATQRNTYRMVGLSHGDTNADYTDIDFAAYLNVDGNLHVYEAGNVSRLVRGLRHRRPKCTTRFGPALSAFIERSGILSITAPSTSMRPSSVKTGGSTAGIEPEARTAFHNGPRRMRCRPAIRTRSRSRHSQADRRHSCPASVLSDRSSPLDTIGRRVIRRKHWRNLKRSAL